MAAWAALDRLLIPSVRWYLRRRVNRVINDLNKRLQLRIEPFALTRRAVLIDRLTYDPEIIKAAEAEAEASGKPREAVVREVARYAREIVPSFNAYAYFRVGIGSPVRWPARSTASALVMPTRRLVVGAGERVRGFRHEPSEQHGLRPRGLPCRLDRRTELCRG